MTISVGQYLSMIQGAKYKLGGRNAREGFDCLTLHLEYIKYRGHKIPKEFEGTTLDNYLDLWNESPDEAKKKLLRFLYTIGRKIPINMSFTGDILIVKPKKLGVEKDQPFMGIHAGHDLILSAWTDIGIRSVNISFFTVTSSIAVDKNRIELAERKRWA